MKLNVFCLLFIGYFIEFTESDGNHGKHVHLKIHVPHIIHKHNHKHTVYKHINHGHGGGKKHIVVHKHDHKHKHDHGHKHGHKHGHNHGHKHNHKHYAKHGHKHDHNHKHGHKHGHKHNHKHKHTYKPYHHYYGHYENAPELNFDTERTDSIDDDVNTKKKSVRTEHYEVKKINPLATFPNDRVVVKGAYKVEETDPHDITKTSYHSYDSPTSKVIAELLTNFGGQYDDYHPFNKKKQEEEYIDEEKESNNEDDDHENNIESGGDHFDFKNYEDYGDETEKLSAYNHPVDEKYNDGYNYGHANLEKYIYGKVYGS